MRTVIHRYRDPLELVWLACARRMGLGVLRSPDAYASTDGQGTLVIGTDRTLDADDSLAQIIFHEICHSLIEGPEAFERPDWGLDNTGPRDTEREHACLRLQAQLAGEYGLRGFLAPTTDFRPFYDALAVDPLAPRGEPSVIAAMLGLARVDSAPWAPHVRAALEATAEVAGVAARFVDAVSEPAGGPGGLPVLWQAVAGLPARHPGGFLAGPTNDPARRCGTCVWRYHGGPGRAVDRCRQADGARIDASWPACDRWEDTLDCQACAACCREAYHSVTISRREPVLDKHPALVIDRGSYIELARIDDPRGNRCAALSGGKYSDGSGGAQPYVCAIYDDRPRPCRELEQGGPHCLTARRRVGLSR